MPRVFVAVKFSLRNNTAINTVATKASDRIVDAIEMDTSGLMIPMLNNNTLAVKNSEIKKIVAMFPDVNSIFSLKKSQTMKARTSPKR